MAAVKVVETACSNLYLSLQQLFTAFTNLWGMPWQVYALFKAGRGGVQACKGRSIHQESRAVSTSVGSLQTFSFFCWMALLSSLLERRGLSRKNCVGKKLFRADQNCWNTDPPGRILPEKSDPHVENWSGSEYVPTAKHAIKRRKWHLGCCVSVVFEPAGWTSKV